MEKNKIYIQFWNAETDEYEWREFMRVNKPVIIVFKDIKSEDWEKIQPEINDILGFDLTDDAGHHPRRCANGGRTPRTSCI